MPTNWTYPISTSRSLIELFDERAREGPKEIALIFEDFGIWHELTWYEYRNIVDRLAHGFESLGVIRGDRIVVMADPSPEWVYTDLAAEALGALTVGVYVTTSPNDLAFLLQDSQAGVFVAGDQEHIDKLLASEAASQVTHIIVVDDAGLYGYSDPRIVSFAALLQLGEAARGQDPGAWTRRVAGCKADDPIAIFYTSGTTGKPKGALLSSRNLLSGWNGQFGLWNPKGRRRIVADASFAHYGGRSYAVLFPIAFNLVAYIPEDPDMAADAMRAVKPHYYFAAPRLWEDYASRILVDIAQSTTLKRLMYRLAMRARKPILRAKWANRRAPILASVANSLGGRAILNPLLEKFGFTNLEFATTGGASVSYEILQLWQEWGIPLRESYGMTEAVLQTIQTEPLPKPGAPAHVIPGVEVRMSEEGEVLVRGDNVFSGYWNNPLATAAARDEEGWLHTGDLGELSTDGRLRIIDRMNDVLITSSGESVPASEIEHALKYSPYIRDAMLVGHGRARLVALIEINFDTVSAWARERSIRYTSFTSLALSEPVNGLIGHEIEYANRRLRERNRQVVSSYRILPKELDPEEGDEVTATRKVKRRLLAKKFDDLVAEMYSSTDADQEDEYIESSGSIR